MKLFPSIYFNYFVNLIATNCKSLLALDLIFRLKPNDNVTRCIFNTYVIAKLNSNSSYWDHTNVNFSIKSIAIHAMIIVLLCQPVTLKKI